MKPILVIGAARSGTTFVSRSIGEILNVPVIVEPHLLWKNREFNFFRDDEYVISEESKKHIRNVMYKYSASGCFVEKSPINCLRALKVYHVFPEARIVFIDRDPQKIIRSNMFRSFNGDHFSFSIFFEKFFKKKGGGVLSSRNEKYIGLIDQVGLKGLLGFCKYAFKGVFSKYFLSIPFGPKNYNVYNVNKKININEYYESIMDDVSSNRDVYSKLFGKDFYAVNLDNFSNEITGLIDWLDEDYEAKKIEYVLKKNFSKVAENENSTSS